MPVLALFLVTEASAQPKAPEESGSVILDPVVVTATLAPTRLTGAPASVTIITREQIEASQAKNVTEALRQVPGLHIDQPGARGSVSSVYLRGGDPNFTLVMIDGVTLNDPTNSRGGSFDFSTLDIDNISRIEIVEGPLSTVYGSGAMSGVINIITRRGVDKPAKSAEGIVGSFGYGRVLVHAGESLGKADYSVSASATDNGEPVEGSGFRGKALTANGGYVLSNTMEIRSTLRYADSQLESFPDDSGGPEFAVRREAEKRHVDQLTLGAEFFHQYSSVSDYSVRLGFHDEQDEVRSPGVAPGERDPFGIPPNASDNRYRRTNLGLRSTLSIKKRLRLTVGADVESEHGSSEGVLFVGGTTVPTAFDLRRDNWAAFLEARYALQSRLLLQGGVRADFPDEFDTEVTPRLGVSYTLPSNGITLRASWGEGFKLPSFFALGNAIVGNPNLLPETSRGAEVGLRLAMPDRRAAVDVALFSSEFENLVDLDEGPPPRLVNRENVTAKGFELGVTANPGDGVTISAQLTYVKTDIKGTDEELRNRPEWRGGFNLVWRARPSVDINLNVLRVGEVLDSSIPTGDVVLDPYTRANLTMTWQRSEGERYFLAVDNLFDAEYEEAVGFPAPGAGLRLGARASF